MLTPIQKVQLMDKARDIADHIHWRCDQLNTGTLDEQEFRDCLAELGIRLTLLYSEVTN